MRFESVRVDELSIYPALISRSHYDGRERERVDAHNQ